MVLNEIVLRREITMDVDLAIRALNVLASGGELASKAENIMKKELNMPNLKLPVMDDGVFWNDIAECKGLKLQQNTVTKSARIIDSNGVRVAWGTYNGMQMVINRLCKEFVPELYGTHNDRMGALDELEKIKELLDKKIITVDEFEEKKLKILNRI